MNKLITAIWPIGASLFASGLIMLTLLAPSLPAHAAIKWTNPVKEEAAPKSGKGLKRSDIIQSFDVTIDASIVSGLKRLAWDYDFSGKDIGRDITITDCRFLLYREPIENPRRELMSQGQLSIENGSVIFGRNFWRTGGMANASYLQDESNVKVTKAGMPVGKMPYFHLYINKGEVARPPLYVELDEKRVKGEAGAINGEYEFYVDDWQKGIFAIKNCAPN